jgi:polygalacturonase
VRKRADQLLLLPVLIALLLPRSAPAAEPASDWMSGFKAPGVAEPKIPVRTARVTEFGAVPDGRTLCTAAIARGLETLAAQGGGTLEFPAGVWLTGPIVLRSHVALRVAEGALVQFSRDYALFKAPGLIFAENAEDVAITGPGIIDGAGDAWRPVKRSKMTEGQWRALVASGGRVEEDGKIWYPRQERWRPRLMVLQGCKRVLLEGTTFQNSPAWNLHPHYCEDLTVRNVTIRNPWYSQNGDGLDIDACRNVVVRGTRLDVGDDAICLKSGSGPEARRRGRLTENVLIEDCVVYHGHGGFTIGSEMSGGVRNVRVNNCVFVGTKTGLRFKSQRGRGGVVENIYISNIRMTDIPNNAISFSMFYGGDGSEDEAESAAEVKPVQGSESTPQFRNIYIQDVVCRGARRAILVQGLPEMPIRGIHFDRVAITAARGVICQDVEDITLRGLEILNTEGSVVQVVRGKDVLIDRLTFAPATESLLAVAGGNSDGIVLRNVDCAGAKQAVTLGRGVAETAVKVEQPSKDPVSFRSR